MNTGPIGQKRGPWFVILIGIVTFGIYWVYWVYKTCDEMKRRTGEGLGGVLGLVIWIVVQPVMAFVIPSELGNMVERDGKPRPMTGWTGLWMFPGGILIIPIFVWFWKVQSTLNSYWDEASMAPPAAAAEPAPEPPSLPPADETPPPPESPAA
jgi:hypothetical protein